MELAYMLKTFLVKLSCWKAILKLEVFLEEAIKHCHLMGELHWTVVHHQLLRPIHITFIHLSNEIFDSLAISFGLLMYVV